MKDTEKIIHVWKSKNKLLPCVFELLMDVHAKFQVDQNIASVFFRGIIIWHLIRKMLRLKVQLHTSQD